MHRDVYDRLAAVLSALPASAWPHYRLLAKRFGQVYFARRAAVCISHVCVSQAEHHCRVSVETITSVYIQTAHLYVMRAVKAFESDIPVYAAR